MLFLAPQSALPNSVLGGLNMAGGSGLMQARQGQGQSPDAVLAQQMMAAELQRQAASFAALNQQNQASEFDFPKPLSLETLAYLKDRKRTGGDIMPQVTSGLATSGGYPSFGYSGVGSGMGGAPGGAPGGSPLSHILPFAGLFL